LSPKVTTFANARPKFVGFPPLTIGELKTTYFEIFQLYKTMQKCRKTGPGVLPTLRERWLRFRRQRKKVALYRECKRNHQN